MNFPPKNYLNPCRYPMQPSTACGLQAPSFIEISPRHMKVFSRQRSPISPSTMQRPWGDRRVWTELQSSAGKRKRKRKREREKKKTSAPSCALAAKNKLVIEKEKKGTRLLAHKATLRDGGGVGGVGGATCVGVCMAYIHRLGSVGLQIRRNVAAAAAVSPSGGQTNMFEWHKGNAGLINSGYILSLFVKTLSWSLCSQANEGTAAWPSMLCCEKVGLLRLVGNFNIITC